MAIPADQNPLWWLFTAEDKADFLKRADAVTLSHQVIDRTARFAATGETPLRHLIGERESHPVIMTEADFKHMEQTKNAKKMLAAITQHNRAVFYAFWFELGEDEKPWWLISFDLRDRATRGNHWKATSMPHAHIISYLTHPRDQIETYVEILSRDPKYRLAHATHVRFEDDGWQDWAWGPRYSQPSKDT